MDKVNLPLEAASEPNEEARQPDVTKKAEGVVINETNEVQKNVLSQPPQRISHKQKLLWLQGRRSAGLWAQCDDCELWRYLPRVLDCHELPDKWFCRMNPDLSLASCAAPEVPISLHDEEDLIHALYAAGSLVLARLPGFPWWPAMVDDCPDTEQYYWLDGFSDIPTHYNVVFFDACDASRAWISPSHLLPYQANKDLVQKNIKKYAKRLDVAKTQANDAASLSITARLTKYSFIARFNGRIATPKVKKQIEIKYQNAMKRKFNIDFSDEDTEEKNETVEQNVKKGAKKTKAKINETESIETLLDSTDTLNKYSLKVQVGNDSAIKSVINEVSKDSEVNMTNDSENIFLPSQECESSCVQHEDTENMLNKNCNEDPEVDTIGDPHEPTCFQTQGSTASNYIPEDTQSSDDFDY